MSTSLISCLRCVKEELDPSIRATYCAMSIGIIISCFGCALFAIYVTMMQFKYKYSNKSKNVVLMMLIISISALYILNEFSLFRSFEKMEGFVRNLLFLACFYYFFDHMKILSRSTYRFYLLMLIVVAMQIIHFVYFMLRLYEDSVCHRKLISHLSEVADHGLHRFGRHLHLCVHPLDQLPNRAVLRRDQQDEARKEHQQPWDHRLCR